MIMIMLRRRGNGGGRREREGEREGERDLQINCMSLSFFAEYPHMNSRRESANDSHISLESFFSFSFFFFLLTARKFVQQRVSPSGDCSSKGEFMSGTIWLEKEEYEITGTNQSVKWRHWEWSNRELTGSRTVPSSSLSSSLHPYIYTEYIPSRIKLRAKKVWISEEKRWLHSHYATGREDGSSR